MPSLNLSDNITLKTLEVILRVLELTKIGSCSGPTIKVTSPSGASSTRPDVFFSLAGRLAAFGIAKVTESGF